MNAVGREYFDLIFMDIIMPKLDGVSASMYIRQQCPSTPIIAMTSNIRPDEVNGYFEHGTHHANRFRFRIVANSLLQV